MVWGYRVVQGPSDSLFKGLGYVMFQYHWGLVVSGPE